MPKAIASSNLQDWGVPCYFQDSESITDYALLRAGHSSDLRVGIESIDYLVYKAVAAPRSIEMTREKLGGECEAQAMVLSVSRLIQRQLRNPISVILESDDEGFIAKTPDLPLYGYGDDREEAINNLKIEIESLYEDLMQDDNFTDEWLQIKAFLKERVAN